MSELCCKNCYEQYNDSTRKPVFLDCSKKCSSICSKCYVQYQKNDACQKVCAQCMGSFTSKKNVNELDINQAMMGKAMKETSMFTIIIKFDSKTYTLEELTKHDTLMKLCTKIQETTNVPVINQNVVFEGVSLVDKIGTEPTTTLESLGIKEDSVLSVVKFANGGFKIKK